MKSTGAAATGWLTHLQRCYGNSAVETIHQMQRHDERASIAPHGQRDYRSHASHAVAHGGPFSVHGQTDTNFDGGTGTMTKQQATRSQACVDCPDGKCLHVTGTLIVKYHVDVAVTMPDVPSGLNECEEAKVRQFINTTLREHENEHVRRFKTYNGIKSIPISVTGCGESDVQSQVQALHDADEQARQAQAQKLSDAIDPFTKSIDLGKCQE